MMFETRSALIVLLWSCVCGEHLASCEWPRLVDHRGWPEVVLRYEVNSVSSLQNIAFRDPHSSAFLRRGWTCDQAGCDG